MRDILDDLHERMREIASKYADEMQRYDEECRLGLLKHRSFIESLEREKKALQQVIAAETARKSNLGEPLKQAAIFKQPPLSDFIIRKLEFYGAKSKDDLRREATLAGYQDDGRIFHMTIQNIAKAGKILVQPDGRYAHPNQNLFNARRDEGEAEKADIFM
jgi:hypothetical protein